MTVFIKLTVSEPTLHEITDMLTNATRYPIIEALPKDGDVIPLDIDQALHYLGKCGIDMDFIKIALLTLSKAGRL